MDTAERHSQLDEALRIATARITGDPNCPPRPGQVKLAHDVLTAMIGSPIDGPGHMLGCAPTGVGKSVGAGLPLFLMAANDGDRGVVSTESKALQAQLVGKDYPLIAQVVKDMTGVDVTFAIHKGFSNYGCALAAEQTGSDLAKVCGVTIEKKTARKGRRGDLATADDVDALAIVLTELLDDPARSANLDSPVDIDGKPVEGRLLAELARWVLTEAATEGDGDRSDYPGNSSEKLWQHVSVNPDECIGDSCPLYDICCAQKARREAQEAAIVVTNHTLLALQASLAVPVVLSNNKLGLFNHLVVDEAHTLPQITRSTGAKQVSARRIGMVAKQINDLVGSNMSMRNARADLVVESGRRLAKSVDMNLASFLLGRGDTAKYELDRHPLGRLLDAIDEWCTQGKAVLPKEDSTSSMRAKLKIRRAAGGLESLAKDAAESNDPDRDFARWVEQERDGTVSLRFSPVDVAPAIAANLFSAKVSQNSGPEEPADPDDISFGRMPLSVSMMSATLPAGFPFDSGVRARVQDYESPFDDAYAHSMLYVPKVVEQPELARIANRNGSRWKFDVKLHPAWAVDRIIDLVRANGGRALVLASTRSAGELYADALRASGTRHTIYSQWDGMDPRQVVNAWRSDMTSVLVGTRSLMTGVDAAGDTCSLVIIDRAPRNPGNVVDDARAELLMNRQDVDKWSADRQVYVSDAALLLEQAAGRLIRRVNDAGMVAVLDPRLMKATPVSYPEQTRAVFMRALRRFAHRTNNLDSALEFLSNRRDLAA